MDRENLKEKFNNHPDVQYYIRHEIEKRCNTGEEDFKRFLFEAMEKRSHKYADHRFDALVADTISEVHKWLYLVDLDRPITFRDLAQSEIHYLYFTRRGYAERVNMCCVIPDKKCVFSLDRLEIIYAVYPETQEMKRIPVEKVGGYNQSYVMMYLGFQEYKFIEEFEAAGYKLIN